jgi:hypothetical protein
MDSVKQREVLQVVDGSEESTTFRMTTFGVWIENRKESPL